MRYIERLERAQRIKKEYKFIERIAEDVSDGFLDTKEEIIKSLKQEIADRKLPEKFKKRIEEIIKNNTKNKNSETDQIKNDIQLLLYEYEDFLYEKADLIIVNTKT
jgi:ElaB/YqjD/DUF883 family membrane-anchored ribosome-binding protein